MTTEEALEIYESKWWERTDKRRIAEIQLFTELLICPFPVFYDALSETLGRDVHTHELIHADGLKAELIGDANPPTIEEIIAMIPAEKLMILKMEGEEQ